MNCHINIFFIFALYIINDNAKSENTYLKYSPAWSCILPSVNSVVVGDIPSSAGLFFPMQQYKSFEEARSFARSLKLSGASEWRKFKKPKDIHTHPDRHYKNSKWINWMDWLGTSNKQCGSRKYKVNDDYFKKFSHNMAYILDFWYADGYMNEKTGLFSITQHKKDQYILENILSEMKSDSIISHHCENNTSFQLVSHEIIKDLKKLGGKQAKSYDIKFPKNIPKKYMPDFIRGLWDGDGCICFQKNEKCYVSSFLSASKSLSEGVLNMLQRRIDGFRGTIHNASGKLLWSVFVCCMVFIFMIYVLVSCLKRLSLNERCQLDWIDMWIVYLFSPEPEPFAQLVLLRLLHRYEACPYDLRVAGMWRYVPLAAFL